MGFSLAKVRKKQVNICLFLACVPLFGIMFKKLLTLAKQSFILSLGLEKTRKQLYTVNQTKKRGIYYEKKECIRINKSN